jgi:hypothetical protein
MYNQSEGTFAVDFARSSTAYDSYLFAAYKDDGQWIASSLPGGAGEFQIKGPTMGTPNVGVVPAGPHSIIGAYKSNDSAVTIDGHPVTTDTIGTVPLNRQFFSIGNLAGSSWLNGTIASITYYPARLPNSKLIELTQP